QSLQRDDALEAFDPAFERAMHRRHTAHPEPLKDEIRSKLLFCAGVRAHGLQRKRRTLSHQSHPQADICSTSPPAALRFIWRLYIQGEGVDRALHLGGESPHDEAMPRDQ